MGTPSGVRALLAHLHFRHDERPVDLVGAEFDLVAFLDLVEHRRVLDPKYHCHRRHVEVCKGTMLDGHLPGALIDLANLAFAHWRGSGSCLRLRMMRGVIIARLSREGRGEQRTGQSEQAEKSLHEIAPLYTGCG